MAKLNINITKGGLGRPSANTDKWAGLIIKVTALPSGWVNNTVEKLQKIEDLEDLNVLVTGTTDDKHIYYHVNEFFRLSSEGLLYVALTTDAFDVDKLELITGTDSNVRIIGYNDPIVMTDLTQIEALNTKAEALFNDEAQPLRIVFSGQNEALLPKDAESPRVMYDIVQDLTTGSLAKTVFDANSGQCNSTGTWLGLMSARSVHQKISWVEVGDISGNDWTSYGLIDGTTLTTDLTETEVEAYLTNGIVVARKYPRSSKTLFSGFRSATLTSDDFAVVTNGRVVDKASVLVYDATLPNLDRPIYVKSDGTLTDESIEVLRLAAYDAIQNNMIAGKTGDEVELSVDENTGQLQEDAIYIDPSQDVLATDTVIITIGLVPVGAAKFITVNIGLRNPNIVS